MNFMTTIYATSKAEYDKWAKFNCKSFHTVLVPENKREIYRTKVQFHLKSVVNNGRTNFGVGLYQILEIGVVENSDQRPDSYYARALYKINEDDVFLPEVEVMLYLNPLYYFSSNGRKDISYPGLIGSTIQVINIGSSRTMTSKANYTSLNYQWTIIEYPDGEEHLPQSEIDFNDDDLLAFYGI